MDDERSRSAALVAGVSAGLAGLVVFLALHGALIRPIWPIAPAGGLISGLAGLVIGAAYAELLPHLPRRPWTAVAVAGGAILALVPAFVLAELRGPVFEMVGSTARLTVDPSTAAFAFLVELVGSATLVGALIGWRLGRTRRAALVTGAAGLVFALGPGHNIPFLGGTAAVGKEILMITASVAIASVVLVELHHRWTSSRS